MTAQAITTEIQKLSPSAVIELFVMDLTLFNEGVRSIPCGHQRAAPSGGLARQHL
jgi:phage-related protein